MDPLRGAEWSATDGAMTDTSIDLVRAPDVALAFHVLAHLDLGRDAASLFDPCLPDRPWRDALGRAYAGARGRLAIHALPLQRPDELEEALRHDPPPALRDPGGRALASSMADALAAERPAFMARLEARSASDRARLELIRREILPDLLRLREGLWERHAAPPPLRVFDCRALGMAGRGAGGLAGRVVAVSLTEPAGHVLCQVLHEEVHAVTDPVVVGAQGSALRDTRSDAPGFAVHRVLEQAAVDVGEALVMARAPRWSEAYVRWRARFGI